MAGTIVELFGSRKIAWGDNASAERLYLAVGYDSESAALTAAQAEAPATYAGLEQRTAEITEIISETMQRISVKYGNTPMGETYYPGSSFDTTGGTQHITQSLANMGKYWPNGVDEPPALSGAIGFDGENVSGCDIVMPVGNWSEKRYLDDGDVNQGLYHSLTGKVNNGTFLGYAAGTVLFMGASGSRNAKLGLWEIDFKFAYSPNRSNLTVGDITVTTKKGWEYMWVRYGDIIINGQKVKVPVAVYVEKVYEEADLSQLPVV